MIRYTLFITSIFFLFSCNDTSSGSDPWVPEVEVSSIKVYYGIGDKFDYKVNVIDTVEEDSMPFKFENEENWYTLNEQDTSLDQITSKGNIHVIVGLVEGKNLNKSNLYLEYYGSLKDRVDVTFYNDSLEKDVLNDTLYLYGKHFVSPNINNPEDSLERAMFLLYTSPAYGSISGMIVEIYVKEEDVVIEDYFLTYNAVKWREKVD